MTADFFLLKIPKMTHDAQPTASHFIDGAYVEDTAGDPIDCVYPATGMVIARVHAATPAVVEQALAAAIAFGERFPTALTHTWCVLDQALAPPTELVIAGDPASPDCQALLATANREYLPNLVLVLSANVPADSRIPLVAGRGPNSGKVAAYYCRDHTCAAPAATPAELRALLHPATIVCPDRR